jgi:hypothetical protein
MNGSRQQRGVMACGFVAALGDENRGVARRRRHPLMREVPLRRWRSVFGCFGLLLRARVSVSRHKPLRAIAGPAPVAGLVSRVARELIRMKLLYKRVTGLDVGKASVTVWVWRPGPRRGRKGQTRTFKTTTGSLG